MTQTSTEHRELVDFNWRSVNVPLSDATSFTVQNLSQDTSYEFYVRARNIIGDGPRSQVVLATTKRAITGSLAPVLDPSVSTGSYGQAGKLSELIFLKTLCHSLSVSGAANSLSLSLSLSLCTLTLT